MKTLAVFLLICAVTALTNAAAVPEAEPDMEAGEPSVHEAVPDAEPDKMMEEAAAEEAFPGGEPDEMAVELFAEEEDSVPVQRSGYCPSGWSRFNSRCFLYVPTSMTWAYAERNCQGRGGNLASVHSMNEYQFIQRMIYTSTNGYPSAWLGGSDAHHEGVWLWTDGSRFSNINWCPGEPNNDRNQHCLQMNFSGRRCWDDLWCWDHRPFVCAKHL